MSWLPLERNHASPQQQEPGDPFIVISPSSLRLTAKRLSHVRSYAAFFGHRERKIRQSKSSEFAGLVKHVRSQSVLHSEHHTTTWKTPCPDRREGQQNIKGHIGNCQPTFASESRYPPYCQISTWKGNSDPFDTTALRLGPAAHGYIAIARRWGFFLQVSASRSARINHEVNETWGCHINAALSNAAALHAILALGLHIRADIELEDSRRRKVLNLVARHKIAALSGLRRSLCQTLEPRTWQEFVLILTLLGLAFYEKDFEAARTHQEALLQLFPAQMVVPTPVRSMVLATSSVWISSILLQRTTLPSQWTHPGPWSDALSDTVKQVIVKYSDIASNNVQQLPVIVPPDYLPSSYHCGKMTSVINLHHEFTFILSASAITPSILQDDTFRAEISTWLHQTKIALSTELINNYLNHVEHIETLKQQPQLQQTPLMEQQILSHGIKALCYASMLLVRMTYYVASADHYQPRCREMSIRSLQRQCEQIITNIGDVDVQQRLGPLSCLWMYGLFVSSLASSSRYANNYCAMHEQREQCRTGRSVSSLTSEDIRFVRASYRNSIYYFQSAKTVLQQCLYESAFMDEHLLRVFKVG